MNIIRIRSNAQKRHPIDKVQHLFHVLIGAFHRIGKVAAVFTGGGICSTAAVTCAAVRSICSGGRTVCGTGYLVRRSSHQIALTVNIILHGLPDAQAIDSDTRFIHHKGKKTVDPFRIAQRKQLLGFLAIFLFPIL